MRKEVIEMKSIASDLESYYPSSNVNNYRRTLSWNVNKRQNNFYRLKSTIFPKNVKKWLLIGGMFALTIIVNVVITNIIILSYGYNGIHCQKEVNKFDNEPCNNGKKIRKISRIGHFFPYEIKTNIPNF